MNNSLKIESAIENFAKKLPGTRVRIIDFNKRTTLLDIDSVSTLEANRGKYDIVGWDPEQTVRIDRTKKVICIAADTYVDIQKVLSAK